MSRWLLVMSVRMIGSAKSLHVQVGVATSVTSTDPDAASSTTSPRNPCARSVPSDDLRLTKAAAGTSTV